MRLLFQVIGFSNSLVATSEPVAAAPKRRVRDDVGIRHLRLPTQELTTADDPFTTVFGPCSAGVRACCYNRRQNRLTYLQIC